METDFTDTALLAPLRLGIVGCSLARARYGAAFPFSNRLKITAMVDPDTRFTRAWSRSLGGDIAFYPDIASLLQSEAIPEALLLDVPLADRAEAILDSLPHCRALLCVPPFAATLEETDRILHAASVHNCLLMPLFPRRFDPIFQQALQMASSGEVGLLQQIRCDWSFLPSRPYGVEIGADPDAGTWSTLLPYVACHAADVCRWCFGDVLTVSADIDSPQALVSAASQRRDTSPLLAIFLLGQEQGPATCHFARSRAVLPAERYTFTGSQGYLELVVSSATHDADAFPALSLHRPGQRPQVISPPEFDDKGLTAPNYRAFQMFQNFADRAQFEKSPDFTGEPARAALEVVHAAYFSAQEGRKISLPLRRSPVLPSP